VVWLVAGVVLNVALRGVPPELFLRQVAVGLGRSNPTDLIQAQDLGRMLGRVEQKTVALSSVSWRGRKYLITNRLSF
jgi:hypothetical protein